MSILIKNTILGLHNKYKALFTTEIPQYFQQHMHKLVNDQHYTAEDLHNEYRHFLYVTNVMLDYIKEGIYEPYIVALEVANRLL